MGSTRTKNARLAHKMAPAQKPMAALKPVVRAVASVGSIKRLATAKRIAVEERENIALRASAENSFSTSSIPLKESSEEL